MHWGCTTEHKSITYVEEVQKLGYFLINYLNHLH